MQEWLRALLRSRVVRRPEDKKKKKKLFKLKNMKVIGILRFISIKGCDRKTDLEWIEDRLGNREMA